MPHNAITDLLPAYLNGTLGAPDAWHVRTHLEGCSACRAVLAEWEAVATAEGARLAVVQPTRDILAETFAAIDVSQSTTLGARSWRSAARQMAQVALRQARLLRPAVWVVSAISIALATYVAAQQPRNDAGLLLGFALPLIAATGISFVADPDADPLIEVARSTPTPPRLIFLSRWSLLFGFDFALSLVGSVMLAHTSHQGVWTVAALWVGPMALLAALSALLAVIFGPFVAAGGALVLWLGRALNPAGDATLRLANDPFWATNPMMLLAALALLALAMLAAERRERFSTPAA